MTLACKELKRRSRENLLPNFRILMGAFLVAELIAAIVDLPFTSILGEHPSNMQYALYFLAQLLISTLTTMLSLGIIRLHLNVATKQKFTFSDLFFCFKGRTDRNVILSFVLVLISLVGNIPSYVSLFLGWNASMWESLGISLVGSFVSAIFFCFLQMFFFGISYVAVWEPDTSVSECFKKGLAIMKGKRLAYLRLALSFVGLYVAVLFTLGIGLLWLIPYQDQTYANFYLSLIETNESNC